VPWYAYLLRALIISVALLVFMRWAGKRTIGELTPVGFVTGITTGTIAGSATVSPTIPVWAGVLALAAWTAFEWINARLTMTSPGYRKLVNGHATTLVQDGRVSQSGLRSALMSRATLRSELRAQKIYHLSQVKRATLEPSGKIGLKAAKTSAPSNSKDRT
jgi:uncharacterized membrane protein YcaP (DUF421 family)